MELQRENKDGTTTKEDHAVCIVKSEDVVGETRYTITDAFYTLTSGVLLEDALQGYEVEDGFPKNTVLVSSAHNKDDSHLDDNLARVKVVNQPSYTSVVRSIDTKAMLGCVLKLLDKNTSLDGAVRLQGKVESALDYVSRNPYRQALDLYQQAEKIFNAHGASDQFDAMLQKNPDVFSSFTTSQSNHQVNGLKRHGIFEECRTPKSSTVNVKAVVTLA